MFKIYDTILFRGPAGKGFRDVGEQGPPTHEGNRISSESTAPPGSLEMLSPSNRRRKMGACKIQGLV